jgi:hypothetical protein
MIGTAEGDSRSASTYTSIADDGDCLPIDALLKVLIRSNKQQFVRPQTRKLEAACPD